MNAKDCRAFKPRFKRIEHLKPPTRLVEHAYCLLDYFIWPYPVRKRQNCLTASLNRAIEPVAASAIDPSLLKHRQVPLVGTRILRRKFQRKLKSRHSVFE